jgi:hypothetical protein
MPICFLAGVLNYLDRTNLNFAALQLNAELGFTPQASRVCLQQQRSSYVAAVQRCWYPAAPCNAVAHIIV